MFFRCLILKYPFFVVFIIPSYYTLIFCIIISDFIIVLSQSLTTVSFQSTSLVSLSLGGCRAITSLELKCPYLEYVSLDGCDHLEKASFSPVSHLSYLIVALQIFNLNFP